MNSNSDIGDFETAAHALIGRLVFIFSRLDVNLALYVCCRNGYEAREAELLRLENTSFAKKLEMVLPAAQREYSHEAKCIEDWETWLVAADTLRIQRNNLVHGRWGVNDWKMNVSNIIGLPGSPNQHEIFYTLPELAADVDEAGRIAEEFWRLRTKWPA